jgi:hypothetical protein
MIGFGFGRHNLWLRDLLCLALSGKGFDLSLPLPENGYQSVALGMNLDLGAHWFVRASLFVRIGLIMIARLPTEHGVPWQGNEILWWDLRCLDA